MASNIGVGQTIRVFSRFADFNLDTGIDEPLSPSIVSGKLYKYDAGTNTYIFQNDLDDIVLAGVGYYYYDWLTPDNGKFKLIFTGFFPSATPSYIDNDQTFYIGTAEPAVKLESDLEFIFLGELDPMYLDPEQIKRYYADVDLTEAAEIIHRFSKVLDSWFGQNYVVTEMMREWILAATLCELSKIYAYGGGLSGFGQAGSFTLGQLQVSRDTKNTSNLNSNGLGLGQATTWCEIAILLRNQLNTNRNAPVSFVKGSSYTGGNTPIPPRKIRNFD